MVLTQYSFFFSFRRKKEKKFRSDGKKKNPLAGDDNATNELTGARKSSKIIEIFSTRIHIAPPSRRKREAIEIYGYEIRGKKVAGKMGESGNAPL